MPTDPGKARGEKQGRPTKQKKTRRAAGSGRSRVGERQPPVGEGLVWVSVCTVRWTVSVSRWSAASLELVPPPLLVLVGWVGGVRGLEGGTSGGGVVVVVVPSGLVVVTGATGGGGGGDRGVRGDRGDRGGGAHRTPRSSDGRREGETREERDARQARARAARDADRAAPPPADAPAADAPRSLQSPAAHRAELACGASHCGVRELGKAEEREEAE